MPEQHDILHRYANVYAISHPDVAKKVQTMFIQYVNINYTKYPFSKDNMIKLAECLERKLVKLFKGIEGFGEIKNIEVLLVRNRSEEMVDYIREDANEPVKLEFSISQERFVYMLLGEDEKGAITDSFRYEYSPYVMQLILAICKNDEYSDKNLKFTDADISENIIKLTESVLKKEIKKKAKDFVVDNMTNLFYNMDNIVELFDTEPRAAYIRDTILKNNDERMTIFIQEVKHRLEMSGKFLDE